jgi:hypothetical protein
MTDEPRHRNSDLALEVRRRWRVDALDAATIEVTTDENGIPAWLLALARI